MAELYVGREGYAMTGIVFPQTAVERSLTDRIEALAADLKSSREKALRLVGMCRTKDGRIEELEAAIAFYAGGGLDYGSMAREAFIGKERIAKATEEMKTAALGEKPTEARTAAEAPTPISVAEIALAPVSG